MAGLEDDHNYYLHLEKERLKTFKNWPFSSSCKCTPKKLAKAGFYHIPTQSEPDAVRCFYCFKELDGWEPNDDPMEEHKSHSPQCKFLSLTTPVEEMDIEKLIRFEMNREKNRIKVLLDAKKEQFEVMYKHVEREMRKLAK